KTSFSNLTHGYYEISEKTSPDGYVLSGDATFYFKIESGAVKWLVKGSNKPSEWEEKAEKADGEIVDFDPAHPAVVADPENNVEAQSAKNATFTVENEPGAALPSTGGPGTRIFAILGSLMILFAGAVLLRRRIL
ncbi:MAG: LPXTG cell wall anchor domain-containing protein, partial [Eubacterium sp.]|nr:LPXTG cell wall anchor domain-containing protein [Eubacterium sp.]